MQSAKLREEMNKREEQNRQTDRKMDDVNAKSYKEQEKAFFEILGIKLYFDDVLIISLILFLYNEGVRDNLLFISLILILMS